MKPTPVHLLSWNRLAAVLALLLALLLAMPQQPAGAAVLLVTKIDDTDDGVCDADCSLREAVDVAANGDIIRFSADMIGEEIVLSGEEILIETSIRIEGLGPTRLTISGNDQSRIFAILETANVEIQGLTLHEGFVPATLTERGYLGGGAILNLGTLTLEQMVITDNRVLDSGGEAIGGGIHSENATLTINNSTISNNIVEDVAGNNTGCLGGGISSAGSLTMFNVTISGNQALDAGGHCYAGGLNVEPATQAGVVNILNMTFVTIANNQAIEASSGGHASGGGISSGYQPGTATVTVRNTLLSSNTPGNCDGIFIAGTESYNLDSDDTCRFGDATDLLGVNPLLGALADNGGLVPTHALQQNSPAIDEIPVNTNNCTAGQTIDARSAVRAGGDNRGGPACDIGAYESSSNQQPTALGLLEVQAGQAGLPLWAAGLLLLLLGLGLLLGKRLARH